MQAQNETRARSGKVPILLRARHWCGFLPALRSTYSPRSLACLSFPLPPFAAACSFPRPLGLLFAWQEDVEFILQATPQSGRQTLLFSATQPPWVKAVARTYLNNPQTIDATGQGESEAATTVEHVAVLTPGQDSARLQTLADVISVYGTPDSRTIVFTSTRRECDELTLSASLAALSAQPLHGEISQNQREVHPSPHPPTRPTHEPPPR